MRVPAEAHRRGRESAVEAGEIQEDEGLEELAEVGRAHQPGDGDATTDLIGRLWPLVKKQLHDSEVGQAHIQRLDALCRQALERPVRLHQDEPQMRARDVGGLPPCGGAPHPVNSLTSRYFMSSYRLNLDSGDDRGALRIYFRRLAPRRLPLRGWCLSRLQIPSAWTV